MKELILNENERLDDLGINDLKLIQNKEYFCFGTDSALLANFVISNNSKNVILDLCSGSGVIPLIISAKKKYSKIIGIEIQKEMYDLFKRNIAYNNLQDKIYSICGDICNITGLKKEIKKETNKEEVDIVVCNPPYKNIGSGIVNSNNVKYIARHEVKCTLEDVFKTTSKILKEKGKLYLVHKPQRLVDLFYIARKYNFEAKTLRFVIPKIGLAPSIVLIEYTKNGGNELKVLPPLIEYNEDNSYTKEFLDIYGIDIERKDINEK